MKYPRILLAAPSSGSGKTLITCGILQALKNRGMQAVSFKCGPDYIDPMFHTKVQKTVSRNLDTFFTDEQMTRYLFAETAKKADISVMEGVMGFYDGLGGMDVKASAYDLARVTETPVVLIVNTKGMSVSVLAQIKGFLEYKKDSRICGVILNQMSGMLCRELAPKIEQELGIRVFGYVPVMKEQKLASRHLGLVLPDEIEALEEQLQRLAAVLEDTLDIDGLLELAMQASELLAECPGKLSRLLASEEAEKMREMAPRIAVARDEAFCFIYEDNLQLLKKFGAVLEEFSPLHGEAIPKGCSGMLLYGGYPELYARELSENVSMRLSVREALHKGMPCLAECGGFMYLHRTMEDMEGNEYEMAGVVDGKAYRTEKLVRFGYVTLSPIQEGVFGETIKGHEFHYFDSTACQEAYEAKKPLRKRSWKCIQGTQNSLLGFPHLYYYSNPQTALAFLEQCCMWRTEQEGRG